MNEDTPRKIDPVTLAPLNLLEAHCPITIDIVYAKADHPDNYFEQLYHPECCIMWAHQDIALLTMVAAKLARKRHDWTIKINDCLRPVDAQKNMTAYSTDIDSSLLSAPGQGAHPRAMAIDIEPLDEKGHPINMGTPFDHFVKDVLKDGNPAARDYTNFSEDKALCEHIIENRDKLTATMLDAAEILQIEILPLPQEWWDFRFPVHIWQDYAPLYESDLPNHQKMIDPDISLCKDILSGQRSDLVEQPLTYILEKYNQLNI